MPSLSVVLVDLFRRNDPREDNSLRVEDRRARPRCSFRFKFGSFLLVGSDLARKPPVGVSLDWLLLKALYRLDPPSKTLQDFLLLSPEEYLQVQRVTAGPLEAFQRRSLQPREWWPQRRSAQLFLNVWHFSHPDLWSRETRTAAPSNPYSHGDLCFGRTANVENGDRGPAHFSFSALNPDFIYSRECVSILLICVQFSPYGVMCCCIIYMDILCPCRAISHRRFSSDSCSAHGLKCKEFYFLFFDTFFRLAIGRLWWLSHPITRACVSERVWDIFRERDVKIKIDGDRKGVEEVGVRG